ncbi:hypothetical protein [Candidatus Endomicrobiellum agilis]
MAREIIYVNNRRRLEAFEGKCGFLYNDLTESLKDFERYRRN